MHIVTKATAILFITGKQTSQLSWFYSETHGFGPLLTVSLSTFDFSLSVLNFQGNPQKFISQPECYVVYNIHTYVAYGTYL